jgi:hypothetical protein
MKKAKSVIAFIFVVVLYVTAACAEYDLAMNFRILSGAVSVCALFVLVGALSRSPEGYEDETGFHVGSLANTALS